MQPNDQSKNFLKKNIENWRSLSPLLSGRPQFLCLIIHLQLPWGVTILPLENSYLCSKNKHNCSRQNIAPFKNGNMQPHNIKMRNTNDLGIVFHTWKKILDFMETLSNFLQILLARNSLRREMGCVIIIQQKF